MVQTQSFELTGFQRDLLYVIAGSDQPSGQTIRRELEEYIENINHGRLYPNLDKLVEYSLVQKGDQDQRTNYYEVTESGEELLTRRREWEDQYMSHPQDSSQDNLTSLVSDWGEKSVSSEQRQILLTNKPVHHGHFLVSELYYQIWLLTWLIAILYRFSTVGIVYIIELNVAKVK